MATIGTLISIFSISFVDDSNVELPNFEIRTDFKLESINISVHEIESIISTLCTNKADGLNFISHIVVMNVANSIALPLFKLFNTSHNDGIFPNNWKESIVNPFF